MDINDNYKPREQLQSDSEKSEGIDMILANTSGDSALDESLEVGEVDISPAERGKVEIPLTEKYAVVEKTVEHEVPEPEIAGIVEEAMEGVEEEGKVIESPEQMIVDDEEFSDNEKELQIDENIENETPADNTQEDVPIAANCEITPDAPNESADDLLVERSFEPDDIPMPELTSKPNSVVIDSFELPKLQPAPEMNQKRENDAVMPELVPIPKTLLEPSGSATSLGSTGIMQDDIEEFLKASTTEVNHEELSPSQKDCLGDITVASTEVKSSIVDSLLDKIRRKNSDSSGSEKPLAISEPVSESDDDLLVEVEVPVRLMKSSNPNLMATPIVRHPKSTSVFVNTEEEYRRTVAKHKPKKQPSHEDKAQMGSELDMPQMKEPEKMNIQRPRTLAEKRVLVNNNNVKFLMVEQESKIFKQVQRRKQKLDINYSLLDTIVHEDIPTSQGPWKVVTWLRTRDGNFIHQYLNIDGTNYKLNGSRGNHLEKFLPPQSSEHLPKYQKTALRSTRCCVGGKIKKQTINAALNSANIRRFILQESVDPFKKLETKMLDNKLGSIKPRPLSKKIEFINKDRNPNNEDDSAFLGEYSRFDMPDIKLEVSVEPRLSLDPEVKKYLKDILPHRDMNENWCNFALSALEPTEKTSFDFVVPYKHNKRHILVREIVKAKEDNEKLRIISSDNDEDVDEMEWTFASTADKDDPIECEVVDIIKDLTNSVFINLNDDLFTQEDTEDRKSSSPASPEKTKAAIEALSSIGKSDSSKRVLHELRRLNANIYKSESQCVDDVSFKFFPLNKLCNFSEFLQENDMRRHATAHLGKKERELRPTVIITDSDTVLLGNQEKESRRIKRVPKRFDDFTSVMPRAVCASDSEDKCGEPLSKKLKVYDHDDAYKHRNRETTHNAEELRSIKEEVRKMLHVSVDLRPLECLDDIEPWCMVHKLYKCQCKGSMMFGEAFQLKPPSLDMKNVPSKATGSPGKLPQYNGDLKGNPELQKQNRQPSFEKPKKVFGSSKLSAKMSHFIGHPKSRMQYKRPPREPTPEPEAESEPDNDASLTDDGFSRRVLPVVPVEKDKKTQEKALLKNSDGIPKIEILNLAELVNGGFGPIYINVYDDTTMRLNPVLRSLLNNKSAIIYLDGLAFFVDKQRVNVKILDFSKLEPDLEHPIFIIQAKDDFPSPVSSTMADEFVKFLFKKDSDSFIQIVDKLAMKDISKIIDSILRNVKKKLESTIGCNVSEKVKEQLSMIKRDRSRSVSASVSSTHSSPLHFHGIQLTEAPPPGIDSELMQEFNGIFSLRMKTLVAMISSNTLGLGPSNEMLNKFYVYQWRLLLKSFEEDLVQIWQVTLEGESGEEYQMLVLTDSRDVPDVEHAQRENIVNIRNLKFSDKLTELTRLILLRVENDKMVNMTILFYGCRGYLRICGILNSKEPYISGFVAKPTRATHPRIAAKIQKSYHIWYASKMRERQRLFQAEQKNREEVEKEKQEELKITQAKTPQEPKITPAGKKVRKLSCTNFMILIKIQSPAARRPIKL